MASNFVLLFIVGLFLQTSLQHQPRRCLLPAVSGPCFALFRKYYYDRYQSVCIEFTYGGCEGNDNRFESYDECRRTCMLK
ncbi:chymotrypsin inhibitor precursor [Biomphalaria pfeifferi]|uniref:Chymotrypsin inhibitor n=1 Tax=Biomphalaria pfeifferi TaxID=112525 RepID=A0AAD8FBT7_BIOPF|nr:chymotrypsin inhibitor precursor [Biomphalaria pfeifferi]